MTLRYKLRTLLIVLAILPPLLGVAWMKYAAWKAEQERLRALRELQAQQQVQVGTGIVPPQIVPVTVPQRMARPVVLPPTTTLETVPLIQTPPPTTPPTPTTIRPSVH